MAETSGISGIPTRRNVVAGVGAAGLAAALAACGSSDNSSAGTVQNAATPATGSASTAAGSGSGTELAKASAIPSGGGTVFKDQKVVVTQPTAGTYKAFTAVCTHSGCVVADVSGGTINCGCHGSKFSIEDGSVKNGPATQPLAAATNVTVANGSVTAS
ncbi:Rieske (2Fe-2S) protein [Actinacidiphila oryziradicis]|uniref:Cytochrome bc1 complex Rieske iron-sulfur subunit n=1 Tax=Actinacidiphila oryziradicis TaxID=2571141 RepID=A0A4U0SHH9_9ACTN|nr:Rieske (2Fe-2S) protein [Actinacidiphila oryziradicis]TKA09134.1 Rieske (2Fe-2S) protein [Actinacidiphila oryziradicis]